MTCYTIHCINGFINWYLAFVIIGIGTSSYPEENLLLKDDNFIMFNFTKRFYIQMVIWWIEINRVIVIYKVRKVWNNKIIYNIHKVAIKHITHYVRAIYNQSNVSVTFCLFVWFLFFQVDLQALSEFMMLLFINSFFALIVFECSFFFLWVFSLWRCL